MTGPVDLHIGHTPICVDFDIMQGFKATSLPQDNRPSGLL